MILSVVVAVAIMIYGIVMTYELQGEELEQLRLQKVDTVPSL